MSAVEPDRQPFAGTHPAASRFGESITGEIRAFCERVSGTRIVVVCSPDGRPLVSYLPESGDRNRLSAIVSSLLAVCETAAREVGSARCSSAVVCTDEAHIVVARIGDQASSLVLATVIDAQMTLGMAIHATRDMAGKILQVLPPAGVSLTSTALS